MRKFPFLSSGISTISIRGDQEIPSPRISIENNIQSTGIPNRDAIIFLFGTNYSNFILPG